MNIEILILLIGLLVALLGLGLAALKKQGEKITDERVRTYYDLAVDIASRVVDKMEQEVVKGLKADGNGHLTAEEGKRVFTDAVGEVKGLLTEETKQVLGKVTTDVNGLAENLVSAAVLANRQVEESGQPVVSLGVAECEIE